MVVNICNCIESDQKATMSDSRNSATQIQIGVPVPRSDIPQPTSFLPLLPYQAPRSIDGAMSFYLLSEGLTCVTPFASLLLW